MSYSTNHSQLNTDSDVTGESYDTRERIHDSDDPHGVLVVLQTLDRRADRFELTDGITVYSVNPSYPATDRVVLCIYERDLDRLYSDWREISPSELRRRIIVEHDQCPPGVNAFPSSRVERYEAGNWTDCGDHICCENCGDWTETVVDVVEHIARECPGVNV